MHELRRDIPVRPPDDDLPGLLQGALRPLRPRCRCKPDDAGSPGSATVEHATLLGDPANPGAPVGAIARRGRNSLHEAPRLARDFGFDRLLIKDEGLNPTGSFKARGLAMAVARAKEHGATTVAIPSAGDAAAAMAAYAARAGVRAVVAMPSDVPPTMKAECLAYGAHVLLVDGLIDDCGKVIRTGAVAHGWCDVSTLREPYRAEGKKTMGLEIAEQLGWCLPDALIYPTGGGTGIVGMWKAFAELETMGFIGPERPKMIAVQAAGCAPIVRAFNSGATMPNVGPRPVDRRWSACPGGDRRLPDFGSDPGERWNGDHRDR